MTSTWHRASLRLVFLLTVLLTASGSQADTGVAPTFSFGLFFEFGDEAGTSGGFELWGGVSVYPGIDPAAEQTAGFLAAGVQLRTGLLPLLTGPNELCPQLRAGLAFLGGVGSTHRDSEFDNLFVPDARVYVFTGYRWAAAFGFDNLKGKRKNEQALRLGVGTVVPALPATLDAPIINGADFFVDLDLDGLDRLGFDVVIGL